MFTVSDFYNFLANIHNADAHLDENVTEPYKLQPLAQDWARVSKVTEEAGEALDALIGYTGQNPRKGHYGSVEDLHKELADTALTAIYGLQHFTKDAEVTIKIIMDRSEYHMLRLTSV